MSELGLVLPNLKELTLHNAVLSHLGADSLHNLKKLDVSGLEAYACETPDAVIPVLKQMPFLEDLILAVQDGFGSSAVRLNDLFELPSLTSLYLMRLSCFVFITLVSFHVFAGMVQMQNYPVNHLW